MSGPFPGMDPYLENPIYWRGFHNAFLSEFCFALNRQLPPEFVAKTEIRCYVTSYEQLTYPDAIVLRRDNRPSTFVPPVFTQSSVTVLEREPLIFELDAAQEIEEAYIEIILRSANGDKVVTVVELLSPSNKAGGTGRKEYLAKQKRTLQSDAHLLEIDFLRAGMHTVAMERAPIAAERPFDYLTCLRRAGTTRPRFEVLPFTVRERIPHLPVPLAAGISDSILDMQAVFDRVYDGFRYRDTLPYDQEPEPPLAFADTAWANALLRERNLRG